MNVAQSDMAMWPLVCYAVGQCNAMLHCLHMIFPNLEANKFLIAKWACLPAALHAPHQHMCQSLGQPYNVGAQPRPHASPTYPTAAAHTCPCCENEAALCGDGGGAAHLLWSLHRPPLCRRGLHFCEAPGVADHDAPAQAGVTAATCRPGRQLHTCPCSCRPCARGQQGRPCVAHSAPKIGGGVGECSCKRWRGGVQPLPVSAVESVPVWDRFFPAIFFSVRVCAKLRL